MTPFDFCLQFFEFPGVSKCGEGGRGAEGRETAETRVNSAPQRGKPAPARSATHT
jgi:hypothetical protein